MNAKDPEPARVVPGLLSGVIEIWVLDERNVYGSGSAWIFFLIFSCGGGFFLIKVEL
jgi:hypothetical protein